MGEEQPVYRTVPRVYQAIVNVTEALSKEGIAKSRKNAQQGYSFRGIDDVYNALSSEIARQKLCMLPHVLERTCEERATKSGGALFYVNVKVRFDLVSAEDGSAHQIITFGEAMDSGDKATNKAQSAAFKYAAMMAFCIPTEGDNDADNQSHDVAPKTPANAGHAPAPTPAPAKPESKVEAKAVEPKKDEGSFWKQPNLRMPMSPKFPNNPDNSYSEAGLANWQLNFLHGVTVAPNRELLAKFQNDNQAIIDCFPAEKTQAIYDACAKRAAELKS